MEQLICWWQILKTDDAECLILKETSDKDAQDSVYEIVEDDTELHGGFEGV